MKRHQERAIAAAVFLVALALMAAAPAKVEAIQVDIFNNYTTCPDDTKCNGGAPYWNPAGSFFSSDVLFATNTNYHWNPFGLFSFGALISGFLNVASSGDFMFTLNSDDGSMLYIDNVLVVDNGDFNGHPPMEVSGLASLSQGIHPFRIEFFEDFGGRSGVDLYLPPDVSYVPEPLTLLLLGFGLMGIAGLRKKTV
jgi:hypothetical protein